MRAPWRLELVRTIGNPVMKVRKSRNLERSITLERQTFKGQARSCGWRMGHSTRPHGRFTRWRDRTKWIDDIVEKAPYTRGGGLRDVPFRSSIEPACPIVRSKRHTASHWRGAGDGYSTKTDRFSQSAQNAESCKTDKIPPKSSLSGAPTRNSSN